MDGVREKEAYLVFDQDAHDEGGLDGEDEREEGVDVEAGQGAGDAVRQARDVQVPWRRSNKRSLHVFQHGCCWKVTDRRS